MINRLLIIILSFTPHKMDVYKWSLVWKWCWAALGSCVFNESKRATYSLLFRHDDFAHLLYVTPILHCTWNKNTHLNFPFKRWCEFSAKCSLHIQLKHSCFFLSFKHDISSVFFFSAFAYPYKTICMFFYFSFSSMTYTHTLTPLRKARTNLGKMKTVYLNLNRIFVKCAFCSKRTNTWLYNRSLHWLDKSDSKLTFEYSIYILYVRICQIRDVCISNLERERDEKKNKITEQSSKTKTERTKRNEIMHTCSEQTHVICILLLF